MDQLIRKTYNPHRSYDHCSDDYWGLSEDYLKTHLAPQSMWNATIDIYDPREIDLVMRYLATYKDRMKRGDGLLINGPYGSGKSTLAVILGMQLAVRGYSFVFCRADKLVRESIKRNSFRCSYDEYLIESSYTELEDWACRAPVLILDNLGGELSENSQSDYGKLLIKNILKERCDEGISTIITTTCKKEELREIYGQALIETIKERIRTVTLHHPIREDLE